MAESPRDGNFVPASLFEIDGSPGEVMAGQIDQGTGRILVDSSAGGTVTSVSVVTANGFAGTVATATTTPAITLTTTITGILQGNGTAISAASTTGSGAVVLATSPTFITSITTPSVLVSGTAGIDYNPGSDIDTDIITVGVTGTPTVSWDESSDAFRSSKPWAISSDGNGDVTHIINGTTITSELELHSSGNADLGGITVHRHTDTNDFGGHFIALRSDGTHAAPTIVQDGDTIGRFIGAGYDGTDYATAAEIRLVVDGTPGANDMPGRIVFLTSPDGSQTLAEAMRISSTKIVTFSGASVNPATDGGASLGTTALGWQNLFGNTGFVLNIENGDWVATHTAGILTVGTGDLRVTTAGTNTASVVTVGGTQTLTSKSLTSPTITTSTLSGAQQLAENASIRLDPSLSADGTYSGTTITGTAGAALAFGDVIYLAAADSRWELADASAASTSGSVLVGICVLAAAADGDPTVILLSGNVRADAAFPAFTVSAPIYISETAGDLTNTAPTTTDSVTRVMGFGLDGNTILLNISPDYVTHV